MARVMGRAASTTVRRAPSRAVERRARRHKVIMESVTQEKKKLRSVICFEAKAPSGYTFIPAGNPELTTACKERCRHEGLQIHAVSTTPHHKTHNLSQHVHRIGYHFPSTVVAAVCSELGLYLTSTGKTVPIYALGRAENDAQAASEVSQITINTDARNAIRDLFPNIPDRDLMQIIKTAFQKGQNKVGTATELPLARRVQLAVVAHVRHVYTNYDRLLKSGSFHEARMTVEQPTLAKVIQWRGDDENGQTVLEDVFREVIVISDSEDSDSEEDAASLAGHRNTSVEILPSDARTPEIHTQAINPPPGQGYLRDPSEEAPPGFRFVTRVAARNTTNRRGFSRYQAWNRAIQDYREGMRSNEQPGLTGARAEKPSPRYAETRIAAPEANATRPQHALPQYPEIHRRVVPGSTNMDTQAQRLAPAPLMDRLVANRHVGVQENHNHPDQQNASAHQFNSRQSTLTLQESPELKVLEGLSGPRTMGATRSQAMPLRMDPIRRTERLPPQSENRSNAPVFVSGPKEQPSNNAAPVGRRPGTVGSPLVRPGSNTQEAVVPSIENHWPPEPRRADPAHPLVHMANRMSLRSVTPGRPQAEMMHPEVIELDGDSDQPSKRRRMVREGSRIDSRSDPRIARPMGFPVSEGFGPRDIYRRVEPVPEHRSRDQLQFRRDFVPVEAPPAVGHLRPISYAGQHGPDTRSVVDRQHISGPHEPHPLGVIGSSIVIPEDRALRAAPAIPQNGHVHPGHWHPYQGHNIRTERPKDPWAMRRGMGGRIAPEITQDRNMYADGFVRAVDHREPPSLGYASRRLNPEVPKPVGDPSQPRTRERDLKYLAAMNMSQAQVPDQRTLPGRVARPEHHRTFSDSTLKTQPHASPPQVPHERPLSGGFMRPLYTTTSQEQNRPVYVQTVEPRTERQPFHPIPDGRHFVVVD